MAHPPPSWQPPSNNGGGTMYGTNAQSWNQQHPNSSLYGQDSQEELQRQISQLRQELQAKDDAVFELSATLATVQAETTHRVQKVESESQAELSKTREALRRAQLEANVAHASLKKQQQQIDQQRQHVLLRQQELEEQERLRKHRPPSLSSFVTPSTNSNIAPKATSLPTTETSEIKSVESSRLQTTTKLFSVDSNGAHHDYNLASRILLTVPPFTECKNVAWLDTLNLLHHVQKQANVSETHLVWELVQRTVMVCSSISSSDMETSTRVKLQMLCVLQQALVNSFEGRTALLQACSKINGDNGDMVMEQPRSRIRLRNGAPKKRARMELASQKLNTIVSSDHRPHQVEAACRLLSQLCSFVIKHWRDHVDLVRASLQLQLVLQSACSSKDEELLPWWERLTGDCRCWSVEGKECTGCIMTLLRVPLTRLTEKGFNQRILVDLESSQEGALSIQQQDNDYWDVYALTVQLVGHFLARSATIRDRLWNNNGWLGQRLLAIVLNVLEGIVVVQLKKAQKLSLVQHRLCYQLLCLLSVFCQTPQGLVLLRTKMATECNQRAQTGIAVIVTLLHFYTHEKKRQVIVVSQAIRLLHLILQRVQKERIKAEQAQSVVPFSFKSLLSEQEELYKSVCQRLVCPDSVASSSDMKKLIQLQLEEIAMDIQDEEDLKLQQQSAALLG